MTSPAPSEFERELAYALHDDDPSRAFSLLRAAELLLPISKAAFDGDEPVRWSTVTRPDGVETVLAFTSVELMTAVLQGELTHGRVTTIAQMCAIWPDNTWQLAINPGTPIAFTFEAGTLARLAAPTLSMQPYATPEAPIPVLQKVLSHHYASILLGDPCFRVSGFAHQAGDIGYPISPHDLLAAVGLTDTDRYLRDDGSLLLLRWPAVGERRHEVSIGGRDAAQADASAGAIIDAPPYVGLGMAPSRDAVVREYLVHGAVLPEAATLVELLPDGSERRFAVLQHTLGQWLLVVPQQDSAEDSHG